MAVQKNKKTRSKRNMRRAHDALNQSTISIDSVTGMSHLRHHISPEGFYRGHQYISSPEIEENEEE